jgi:hypothetical protein
MTVPSCTVVPLRVEELYAFAYVRQHFDVIKHLCLEKNAPVIIPPMIADLPEGQDIPLHVIDISIDIAVASAHAEPDDQLVGFCNRQQ